MSRTAKITAFVGDGDYPLCLRIGELVELQERTDAGPAEVLARLQTSRWRVPDLTQTLRLALIGGGMSAKDAFDHVAREVTAGRLHEYILTAASALGAAIYGVEEEPLGEPEGATTTAKRRSRKAANAGAASTPSAG